LEVVVLCDLRCLPLAKHVGREQVRRLVDLVGVLDAQQNEVVEGPVLLGRHLEPPRSALAPGVDVGDSAVQQPVTRVVRELVQRSAALRMRTPECRPV